MKKLFRLSVFFVSYTPLWLSIAYIDLMNVFYHKTPSPWTEIISVVCICIAYLISVQGDITCVSDGYELTFRLRRAQQMKASGKRQILMNQHNFKPEKKQSCRTFLPKDILEIRTQRNFIT